MENYNKISSKMYKHLVQQKIRGAVSTVSVSNIGDIVFLPVFRNYADQKFHDFYRLCYNFWTIYGGFPFFLNT